MKGKILLCNDDFSECRYSVLPDIDYGYCISISINLDTVFEDLITNYQDLDESIKLEIAFNQLDNSLESLENIDFLMECQKNKEDILSNAAYVEFNFSLEEILEYIKRNPILKTKKIILNDSLGLNTEILKMIEDCLDGFTDNLYFKLSDNTELISFHMCRETYKKLEMIASEISQYGFSPMEKIMYVYDFVRSRIYVDADNQFEGFVSRDLSSVLFGDKIVCLGYARLMDALLNMLGIDTRVVYLYDDEQQSGHARNEIYVKDEKYGVDGVYYFDATWDSKSDEQNDNYLLSYRYFAMTKSEIDKYDDGKIVDRKFPCFSSDLLVKAINIIENEGIDKVPKNLLRSINHMSSVVTGSYLVGVLERLGIKKIDVEDISLKLADIVDCFDRPIFADTLLEVLYNVRKIQYYSCPSKYPFDLDEFYKTVLLSNWYFDGKTPEEKLIIAIYGNRFKTNTRDYMEHYDNAKELSKSIEQVKLTRTLRKVYERKKEENS